MSQWGRGTSGILWVKKGDGTTKQSAGTKSVSKHLLDIILAQRCQQGHFWQGNPCWPSCSLVCLRGSMHMCKAEGDGELPEDSQGQSVEL